MTSRTGRRGADDAVGDDSVSDDGDSDHSSDDSEEEEEDHRVQEAIQECRIDTDDYQPVPQLFVSMDASSPTQEDMVEAEEFDS